MMPNTMPNTMSNAVPQQINLCSRSLPSTCTGPSFGSFPQFPVHSMAQQHVTSMHSVAPHPMTSMSAVSTVHRIPLPPTNCNGHPHSVYPAQCQQATVCGTKTMSAPQHQIVYHQPVQSPVNTVSAVSTVSPHHVVQAQDSCSIPSTASTASIQYAASRGTVPQSVAQQRYSPMNHVTTARNLQYNGPQNMQNFQNMSNIQNMQNMRVITTTAPYPAAGWNGVNVNGMHGVRAMNGMNTVNMNGVSAVNQRPPINTVSSPVNRVHPLSPHHFQCKLPSFGGASGISPTETMTIDAFPADPSPPNPEMFGL